MNNQVIPEENEKTVSATQENATFLVIGDKAYTSEIIEEYNRNAEVKTEEFNTNATNKTNDFNTNYDNKIAAFNSNANTQKEEFDSHVLMQTNTFNKNAASTIVNYNSNAEQKTNEFNQNALSYQEGIDANKKHIINVSNELERVKTDILETGEDTDTFLHLEDSAMAEYQELSVDGVCKQETTSGKNLLSEKIESTSNAYFYKDNGFEVKAGITYTLSCDTVVAGIYVMNMDGTNLFVAYNKTLLTFTPAEDSIVWFSFYFTNDKPTKYQLEEGSIATDFEPYTGGQPSPNPDYPQEIKTIEDSLKITSNNGELEDSENYLFSKIEANLPEGEFIGKIDDTYKDILKVEYNEEDGQYHLNLYKNLGKVVFDGSESGWSSFFNENGIYNYYINEPTIAKIIDRCISNYFNYTASYSGNNMIGEFEIGGRNPNKNGNIVFNPFDDTTNKLNEFKTWLSTHNTEVYYALKTPYVVDLGVVDMPITYNEVTNLFTDSDLLPNINAKYYRNFITTIQNLQVNEKALKQELVDINTRLSALENASSNVVSESEVVE